MTCTFVVVVIVRDCYNGCLLVLRVYHNDRVFEIWLIRMWMAVSVVWLPIPYKDVNGCIWMIYFLIILLTNTWEILKNAHGQCSLNLTPRMLKNVQPAFCKIKDRP